MAIVNEVVTKFSFAGNLKPQESFNKNLDQSIKLVAGFAAASVAAAGAFAGWVNSTLSAIDPMIQLSRETGVSIEAIQELGYVAEVSGSSAQALQASISSLSQNIGRAAQFGSEEFSRLGISVRDANGQVKTADVIIRELSSRFKQLGLSQQEQQSFAQALGIDPSLIQLMQQTGSEMDALRERARKLGIINKEQADAAADYNDSITTLKFGFSGLQNIIAVGFSPEMKRLANGFIGFLETNKDVIANGITKFGEAINVVAASVVRLMPVIAGIATAFGIWKIATIGLGRALAIAFAPVYLITAAIVGIILAVDDLIVAFNGGKSVIADFFQESFGIDIVEKIQYVIDVMKELWQVVSDLASIGLEKIGAAFDFVFGDDNAVQTTLPVGQAVGATSTSPIQNNRVDQNVNINIATTDPVRAGTAVQDNLQNQIQDAQTQFKRGGR